MTSPSPITIAIDGPAGTGKSTTARHVAGELGYLYIDSGAMYRAITLYLLRNNVAPEDAAAVTAALDHIRLSFQRMDGDCALLLNDERPGNNLRYPEVGQHVSTVAAIPAVREACVVQQRRIGSGGGVVMDGRDIGSVVFPEAELKIFLVADLDTRVERRRAQLASEGVHMDIDDIRRELIDRDWKDQTRNHSPLIQASDAHVLDTSDLQIDDQVTKVAGWAQDILAARA